MERSECISGLVWVIVNRSVATLTVFKCLNLSACKSAKSYVWYARYSNDRVGLEYFMFGMFVCLL